MGKKTERTSAYLAQNGPATKSKRPNKGKRFLHSTCA